MLPLRIKQTLIVGAKDTIVWAQHNRAYSEAAQKSGDDVQLMVLDNAAHFDVIAPSSPVWPTIETAVLSLLDAAKK